VIAFLLCPTCKRAWTAVRIEPCRCGSVPDSISPFAGERWAWLDARLPDWRRAAVIDAANFRDRAEQQQSLARGIAAKGNATARLVLSNPNAAEGGMETR
jgi:hypothetical protein